MPRLPGAQEDRRQAAGPEARLRGARHRARQEGQRAAEGARQEAPRRLRGRRHAALQRNLRHRLRAVRGRGAGALRLQQNRVCGGPRGGPSAARAREDGHGDQRLLRRSARSRQGRFPAAAALAGCGQVSGVCAGGGGRGGGGGGERDGRGGEVCARNGRHEESCHCARQAPQAQRARKKGAQSEAHRPKD